MDDHEKNERIAALEAENAMLRKHLADLAVALIKYGTDIGDMLSMISQV